jgi:hypothetical protein
VHGDGLLVIAVLSDGDGYLDRVTGPAYMARTVARQECGVPRSDTVATTSIEARANSRFWWAREFMLDSLTVGPGASQPVEC